MSAMEHKGYYAAVEFDADDMILVGRIAGINDVVGFHADDAEGLKLAFEEAVDGYLDACAKIGKSPEKAYSGKVMLRVTPEIHAKVALAAQLAGMSLNQFSEAALAEAAGRKLARA